MAFKNKGAFFKNDGLFQKKNNGHFFENDGHFFSIFREKERRNRKNGELKRNEKRKISFDISLITRKSLPLQHTL
jgi:hypothetical protein